MCLLKRKNSSNPKEKQLKPKRKTAQTQKKKTDRTQRKFNSQRAKPPGEENNEPNVRVAAFRRILPF